jgi:DNA (cytosine-5)-methyltransferase 1
MRFVSLFAGVGGFDLGLEMAGHECLGQVEIDKHCQKVLAKHWPDIPRHDDVRTAIDWAHQVGLAFAEAVEARWILLENVPGLLTSNQGRDFGTVLTALADAGYVYAEWRLLDSQFFGVPQRRRRVFLVASVGEPSRRPLLVEPESSGWDSSSRRTQGEDIAGTVERSVGFSHNQGLDIQASVDAFPTLRAGGGGLSVMVRESEESADLNR